MPQTLVSVFRAANGEIPLKIWLDKLEVEEPRAYAKCLDRILRLEALGYEIREPHSKPLRDGIHELRARIGNVNYRILYSYSGTGIAILSHGITKEGKVPDDEIDTAVARKDLVKKNPDKYTADFDP